MGHFNIIQLVRGSLPIQIDNNKNNDV